MTGLAPEAEVVALPPLPSGWYPVRYAVVGRGSLAVVATDFDIAEAWAGSRRATEAPSYDVKGAQEPYSRAVRARAQLLVLGREDWTLQVGFALQTPFPLVDRYSDGDWLIVSSRSEPGSANARVIAADGSERRRFPLGDGVEHVAIDGADRIWVVWFDEGVFGNDDWHVPGREWPPSSDAVGCFSNLGAALPEVGWPAGIDRPADCYALNVTGGGVWVCPYTDFPFVRLVPGKAARWWRTDLAGPRAIAVADGHALAAGGYAAEADALTLLSVSGEGRGEDARVVGVWRLPLRPDASGAEWQGRARPDLLAARGDTIHLVDDGVWRRWRVGDLRLAAAGG